MSKTPDQDKAPAQDITPAQDKAPASELNGIRLVRLTGDDLVAHLPDLARLRIEVFRDFPYLYDGDLAYEETYLQTYVETPDSVIVGAFDGGELVGASTALPLAHETDNFIAPFRERGYDADKIFYFGESVLRKSYRGRGIGVAFFDHREYHARSFGSYTHASFCGVIRPDDHPRRPEGYQPLDAFWRKRGFAPLEGVIGKIAWKDLDEAEETEKPMRFWIKEL